MNAPKLSRPAKKSQEHHPKRGLQGLLPRSTIPWSHSRFTALPCRQVFNHRDMQRQLTFLPRAKTIASTSSARESNAHPISRQYRLNGSTPSPASKVSTRNTLTLVAISPPYVRHLTFIRERLIDICYDRRMDDTESGRVKSVGPRYSGTSKGGRKKQTVEYHRLTMPQRSYDPQDVQSQSSIPISTLVHMFNPTLEPRVGGNPACLVL